MSTQRSRRAAGWDLNLQYSCVCHITDSRLLYPQSMFVIPSAAEAVELHLRSRGEATLARDDTHWVYLSGKRLNGGTGRAPDSSGGHPSAPRLPPAVPRPRGSRRAAAASVEKTPAFPTAASPGRDKGCGPRAAVVRRRNCPRARPAIFSSFHPLRSRTIGFRRSVSARRQP